MFLKISVLLHLGQLVLTNSPCINVRFQRIQQSFMAPLRQTRANKPIECGIQCMSEPNCDAFLLTKANGTCSLFHGENSSSAGCIKGPLFKKSNVRLVPGPQAGRLEIKYQSTWGTVCDDGFTDVNARVVCRELGLPSGNAVHRGQAHYGQGSDPILLDNVQCVGNESFLSQCSHLPWGTHNCRHHEDVGVLCQ
ncbi:scavenger receptor cysteine-rich domain-containing group B protein-like [Haliotis rufescens]|uniref:scavenger receptor cysteine-rich domain-containing group B protein-like n=1 Tax=Haliotis rufescens TaxID=6454 RepID=UPI00201F9CC6|nr:scavenger receptor cysteine-rich domain-containing group B protein-like [Haliotis rufescens]